MADVGTIQQAAVEVENLVSGRFLQSQQYAANAWAAVNSYLNQLVTLTSHPGIDTTITVPFNYTGPNIIALAHGNKPTEPEFSTTLDLPLPTLGSLKDLPNFDFLTEDLDSLRYGIIQKLQTVLKEGATGLSAEAEQAIFDRVLFRREVENERMYTEAENYFAARGFELPTGALAARLQEVNIQISRNNAQSSNDVMIAQAQLAQTNFQFVLKEGATVVLTMIESALKASIEYNDGVTKIFTAKVEEYKADIQKVLALIEAQSKVYIAEVQAYASEAQIDIADIGAQIDIAKVQLQTAELKANLLLKEADIELQAAMKLHELQLASFEAGTKVTGQIVASALAAVNASATLGFSAGLQAADETKSDLTKSIDSGSITEYIHQYSETT